MFDIFNDPRPVKTHGLFDIKESRNNLRKTPSYYSLDLFSSRDGLSDIKDSRKNLKKNIWSYILDLFLSRDKVTLDSISDIK